MRSLCSLAIIKGTYISSYTDVVPAKKRLKREYNNVFCLFLFFFSPLLRFFFSILLVIVLSVLSKERISCELVQFVYSSMFYLVTLQVLDELKSLGQVIKSSDHV